MTLFVYEEWVVLAVDVVVGTQCVHRNVLLFVFGSCDDLESCIHESK